MAAQRGDFRFVPLLDWQAVKGRLGGGDIRSFVIVIVLGLSAYFVMSGPLAHVRVWLFPVEISATGPQGLGQFLNLHFRVPPSLTGLLIGIPIIGVNGAILWYALRENGFHAPLTGGGRLLREFFARIRI